MLASYKSEVRSQKLSGKPQSKETEDRNLKPGFMTRNADHSEF